jgi:cytochrome b involved in lipid metabolism
MNTKKTIIGIVVAVIIVGAIVLFARMSSTSSYPPSQTDTYTDDTSASDTQPITSAPHETTNPGAPSTTPKPTPTPSAGGYTLAQVATHNNRSSCWTAINGNVYDVTSWISRHPGGSDAILYLCGKDGSAAFNDQHGGQGRPESELASFKIGVVK